MENYLYFAAAVVETGDDNSSEALMVPASSYIGADPTSATTTQFRFAGADGDDENVAIVTLTHGSGNNKEVIRGMLSCINANTTHGGFVVLMEILLVLLLLIQASMVVKEEFKEEQLYGVLLELV